VSVSFVRQLTAVSQCGEQHSRSTLVRLHHGLLTELGFTVSHHWSRNMTQDMFVMWCKAQVDDHLNGTAEVQTMQQRSLSSSRTPTTNTLLPWQRDVTPTCQVSRDHVWSCRTRHTHLYRQRLVLLLSSLSCKCLWRQSNVGDHFQLFFEHISICLMLNWYSFVKSQPNFIIFGRRKPE